MRRRSSLIQHSWSERTNLPGKMAGMKATDDDDLKALRASSWALKHLEIRLPQFLQILANRKISLSKDVTIDNSLSEILELVGYTDIIEYIG